jgi:hypothetical protein
MPFKDEAFFIAASIHAIRNFQDTETILDAFTEMKRVTQKGGRVIIAETLPSANNKAQEAHLKMFSCKVKYTRGDMPYQTDKAIVNLLEKAGLTKLSTKTFDFNLNAAPALVPRPFFLHSISKLPEKSKKKAEREYNEAVEAMKKWGEASPPTMLIEATVE